jgi:hypothetical protein
MDWKGNGYDSLGSLYHVIKTMNFYHIVSFTSNLRTDYSLTIQHYPVSVCTINAVCFVYGRSWIIKCNTDRKCDWKWIVLSSFTLPPAQIGWVVL